VSPSSSPEQGQETITLTGCFNCSLSWTVDVGTSPCTGVRCVSATTLTCVTSPLFVSADRNVSVVATSSRNESAALAPTFTIVNRVRPNLSNLPPAFEQQCVSIPLDCVVAVPVICVAGLVLLGLMISFIKQCRYRGELKKKATVASINTQAIQMQNLAY
jgi:hypothetical protein